MRENIINSWQLKPNATANCVSSDLESVNFFIRTQIKVLGHILFFTKTVSISFKNNIVSKKHLLLMVSKLGSTTSQILYVLTSLEFSFFFLQYIQF